MTGTRALVRPARGRPSQAPARADGRPVALTEVSWTPRHELHVSEWVRQGRWIGTLARAGRWWLGDWLRYGNARYGERYRAAAAITGYDVQTLMNIAYVASRFEISRRRENLSFTHHAELAALPAEEQDRWLDRAERESLSARALRGAVRQAAQAPATEEGRRGRSATSPEVVCPTCGRPLSPDPS